MKYLAIFVATIMISLKAMSGSNWTSLIDSYMAGFSSKVTDGSVLVMPIVDSSRNAIYLPFTNQLKTVLISSLEFNGVATTTNPLEYQFLLKTSFKKSKEGLFLNTELIDKNGDKIFNNFLELKDVDLPTYWRQREIKDIAYEIAGKIDREIPAQRYNVINKGLSGGEHASEKYISDFTVVMDQNINEELNKLDSIVFSKKRNKLFNLHYIEGKFRVSGKSIFVNYSLINESDNRVVASASTEFTMDSIPQGMSIYPANKDTVKKTFDNSTNKSTPIAVWVNHDVPVYKDGDRLEVSIRPDVDAYVRAFYVMNDGVICQIFPASKKDTGFLQAGKIHVVGDEKDNQELFITDTVIGQETIKVFASLTPIKDDFLPTKFIDGVHHACTDSGYKSLKTGIKKGFGANKSISPVNEVNILVK